MSCLAQGAPRVEKVEQVVPTFLVVRGAFAAARRIRSSRSRQPAVSILREAGRAVSARRRRLRARASTQGAARALREGSAHPNPARIFLSSPEVLPRSLQAERAAVETRPGRGGARRSGVARPEPRTAGAAAGKWRLLEIAPRAALQVFERCDGLPIDH